MKPRCKECKWDVLNSGKTCSKARKDAGMSAEFCMEPNDPTFFEPIGKKFKVGKWYKTSDGLEVEFIKDIKKDGMYNVFRYSVQHGFEAYYTDKNGVTGYGSRIVSEIPESTFQPEYFSALNEKDAEKYIGKVMEFANDDNARNNRWNKAKLCGIVTRVCPFITINCNFQFMRTCSETFQKKKKVKKTVEVWMNRYPDRFGGYAFATKEKAEEASADGVIEQVKLTGEYEVEE